MWAAMGFEADTLKKLCHKIADWYYEDGRDVNAPCVIKINDNGSEQSLSDLGLEIFNAEINNINECYRYNAKEDAKGNISFHGRTN